MSTCVYIEVTKVIHRYLKIINDSLELCEVMLELYLSFFIEEKRDFYFKIIDFSLHCMIQKTKNIQLFFKTERRPCGLLSVTFCK
jgi:hypothetical protein